MSLPDYPVTAEETYLSVIAGEQRTLPDHPETTVEQYLDYIATHGGGGTDSGAVHYTADTGKTAEQKAEARANLDVYSKSEADVLYQGKVNQPTIETTLPATAVVNTIYKLNTGGATSAAITTALPNGTAVGDIICILWDNGATPATVTITGTLYPFSFTPSANKHTELNAFWDGEKWSLVTNEQAVSA